MCGIAGYIQRASSNTRAIEQMTSRLAHRGPDGQGIWEGRFGDWTIALGHRRLSIIDIEGGRQPLSNEDQSVWITFNGEIYNFRELQKNLEDAGHRFVTRCDTESIVHGYEEHGEQIPQWLNGMFAFALWDQRAGRLLIARDRIGIKPLYYAQLPDGGIAFASELSALLEHPAVDRSIDQDGLTCLFFLDYISPPHTIARGAKKLEPGHFITWTENARPAPKAYWTLSLFDESSLDSESELKDRLRDGLRAAVKSQLISDAPLGVFLSGGIDSSLVAALAAQENPEPLKTFSIAFEDPDFDESPYARLVAKKIGSNHFEQTLSEDSLLRTLDRALDCLDEPIGDSSILPTYLLSQLASEHVKVALGGDGGDELWGGYPTYRAHRYAKLFAHIPAMARKRLISPLVHRLPVRHGYQSLEWKLKRFVLRWDDHPGRRHLRWMSNTDLPELFQCFHRDVEWPAGLSRLTADFDDAGDVMNQILALDLRSYLPGAVLTKVDRASMAHGLEVRPPMLDERLVKLAFSIPSEAKLRGGRTKHLLKRAAEGLLPEQIINRPKKGFAIPLARWLKGPLRSRLQAVIEDSRVWDNGLLNRDVFRKWFEEHQSDRVDRSRPLWALFVLEHTTRNHHS